MYAALGLVVLAPLAAAFRGAGSRRPGGQDILPSPQGVAQLAQERIQAADTLEVWSLPAAAGACRGNHSCPALTKHVAIHVAKRR